MKQSLTNLRRGLTALVVGLIVVITIWSSLTQSPATLTVSHDGAQRAYPVSVPAHCWTGDAPKDVVIPGHVWATIPGGKTGIFGAHWTGIALDDLARTHKTFGLTVMGFCR